MSKLLIKLGVIIFLLISCNDFLDTNENINEITELPLETSLPISMVLMGENIGSFYAVVGGFWSQHYAQSNSSAAYSRIDNYNIVDYGYAPNNNNSTWLNIHQVLNELQTSINKASIAEKWDYELINTVLLVYIYQLLVDYYDEIPYFEALQTHGNQYNLTPNYDKGSEVYLDLLDRIDNAIKNYSRKTNYTLITDDLIFNGNMQMWISFANTLKLKLCIRMSNINPDFSKQKVLEMYNNQKEFLTSDARLDIYKTWDNSPNPLYYWDRVHISTTNNLKISATLFNYLETNSDPRLNTIIDHTRDYDTLNSVGMPQGGFNISTDLLDPNTIKTFALTANQPIYLISEVESYFLQAEAIERGWGTGNAKDLYNKAIITDFSRKNLNGQELGFLSSGGIYEYPVNADFESKLKAIIMAKWTALAGTQSTEAFFETNRTGYPEISTIPAWKNNKLNEDYKGGKLCYSLEGLTDGLFPKRLPYPENEILHNKNTPQQNPIYKTVWWDTH